MSAGVIGAPRVAPPFGRDRMVHGWLAIKGVSDAGDAAWTIALAWTAVQVASPAVAGAVVAAGTVPRALVLLLGGVVADRADTKRVLVAVTVARLVVLAGALVAVASVGTPVPVLIAVAVGFGCSDAVFEPSAATLARQLVAEDDLTSYAGLAQTVSRLGTMIGAAVGGGLVALGGLAASAWANAATYACVLVYLVVVLRLRFPLPRAAAEPVLRSIAAAVGYLRTDSAARLLLFTLSGLNLAVGPALGLGVALQVDAERWGAGTLGVLQALVGAGALAGALVLVRWRPQREARWGFVLLAGQGLAIVLLCVPSPVAAVVACLVIGVTAGSASTLLGALFMRTVAPEFLGRVSSIQRLGDDVLMPAAMSAFGALASGASVATAFVVFGGAMTALMVVAACRREWSVGAADPAGPRT